MHFIWMTMAYFSKLLQWGVNLELLYFLLLRISSVTKSVVLFNQLTYFLVVLRYHLLLKLFVVGSDYWTMIYLRNMFQLLFKNFKNTTMSQACQNKRVNSRAWLRKILAWSLESRRKFKLTQKCGQIYELWNKVNILYLAKNSTSNKRDFISTSSIESTQDNLLISSLTLSNCQFLVKLLVAQS